MIKIDELKRELAEAKNEANLQNKLRLNLLKKFMEAEQRLAEAGKDAERFRIALKAYKSGLIQSSNGNGYIDVFLSAIAQEEKS